ncbi:hypothetical protein K2X30_11285 [bacterium]|jgi:hypothetical protein|nr:hypothetical protein [bacterium]
MKNLIALSVFLFAVSASWAETPEEANWNKHPCAKIYKACHKGGFIKGGHQEGKGLVINCMKPLMEGKTVPGVTVDAAVIKACQEKKADWKEKHKQGA